MIVAVDLLVGGGALVRSVIRKASSSAWRSSGFVESPLRAVRAEERPDEGLGVTEVAGLAEQVHGGLSAEHGVEVVGRPRRRLQVDVEADLFEIRGERLGDALWIRHVRARHVGRVPEVDA